MIVIADSAPINYLVLIGESELLPVLYGSVAIPIAVLAELRSRGAPSQVREWVSNPPLWLRVETVDPAFVAHTAPDLDPREREAIALARQLQAELLVIDDRAGRREARRWDLTVTGTLGVLRTAAARGLIQFREVIERLQQTSFYISADLLQQLLDEDDLSH
jgi:predicted nucleic acid-binding protein